MGSEHIQNQAHGRSGPSSRGRMYGLLRDHRETSRGSGPEPEMGACSNRRSSSVMFSAHTLCCTFVGVWSTTVHTNSRWKWNCPVTGNQKNMSKAVCLESTEFLSFSSAPSEYLSLFFHWAHGITSTRTFSPRSFQTIKEIAALVNHF